MKNKGIVKFFTARFSPGWLYSEYYKVLVALASFPHICVTHSQMSRSYLLESLKQYFYLFAKYYCETEIVLDIFT